MTPIRTRAVKTRRLSPWRVLIAVSAIGIGIVLTLLGWREFRVDPAVLSNKPWFAPYVDVTATPQFNFEQLGANTYKDAILAFIVASPNDGCEPTWGGEYTLDQASSMLDLDRRIARLKQQGGTVAVSFGGLANNELATTCRDESKLLSAYRTVVERYDLTTIDIDLENEALADPVANTRRAKVISSLQKERREADKPFAVWATIPVTPQGLNEDGTNATSALLKNSVDLAGVNIMTMNYNSVNTADRSTADIAIDAITHTKRQISVLYEQAGIHLNDATLWRKIGITPMIGQTDVKREVFTITDAKKLNRFAVDNHAGRMSMWSANRDAQCGSNYVDVKIVSDSCSGVKQERFAYMLALGNGFIGTIAGSAVNVTVSESKQSVADNPDTSPYPLWVESAAYLQGSKIVWQGNVYEAKWWTRGDQPDNPVLQSWETPWKLVGPVLPGEKRIEQPKLPDDTYVQWSGDDTYETGQRVLFEGTPYEAKWWTRGDSPAAASSDPSSSPWVALAQSEINDILKNSE